MSADLVEWLRAQLDGDEQAAREAGAAPWEATVPGMVHVSAAAIAENRGLRREGYVATVDDRGKRYHIALHDPARVLREVEAKRLIVGLHASDGAHECPAGHDSPGDVYLDYERTCLTLRLLALPCSDRPGYREEWRP